jgi:glycine/D-amino acid oxidase-like deaminating enzyme
VKVAVIGGGVAGTAAAWALRRLGVDVTVIHDRAGASSLYSGALDDAPWEEAAADSPLDSDSLAFAVAVEAWSVGTKSARVATYEGVLRSARGRDSSLLDLAPLAGKRVAVLATRVDGWDAAALSRSLGASAWAARTQTRFQTVAADGGAFDGARRASPYDVAALLDEPSRLKRLAESLRGAPGSGDAWLLGPWLGTHPGVGETLSSLVGKPCGETTSPPGGPAGARFDASRDVLLANIGALLRRERVQSLEQRGTRFLVAGNAGGLTANDAGFDAVILAIGGVVGGGVVLAGTGSEAAAFRPCVRVGVELGFGGRPFGTSSDGGVDFATLGLQTLERVGILTEGSLARGFRSLFVAGDSVADAPRTALGSARSGFAAARAVASMAAPLPAAALRAAALEGGK